MRRELWETLVDAITSVAATATEESALRVTRVTVAMPIEVRAEPTDVGFRFLADLPRWSIATGFDEKPGHLTIQLEAEGNDD